MPKQWPAEAVEKRATKSLIPYARNARVHPDAQVAKVAASIQEWGWTNPVLIDEEGVIIAGHCRILAAERLGIKEVPVMVARGWSEGQRRAYVIADNKLALGSEWDDEALGLEFDELADLGFDLELTGFSLDEIAEIVQEQETFGSGSGPGGAQEDEDGDPIDPTADPVAQAGDVWACGPHRVVCGDATDPSTVARCLGGAVPGLMVTDPPYGVEYEPEWRNEALDPANRATGEVENDDRADWREAWKLFPGDVAYVWHASTRSQTVFDSLTACDFDVRSCLIWAKSRFAISRGHYHWQHEPCLYAVRKGKTSSWSGGRSQTTLWQLERSDDSADDATVHGTQKPVEAMARPMRNHDHDGVYDPFLGSGTTLVAAEKLGRVCYGIEIDPRYVDVIIERWQRLTGGEAVIEGTGETFNSRKGVEVDG